MEPSSIINMIPSPIWSMGGGGLLGLLLGFAIRKILVVVGVVLGLGILVLMWLNHEGIAKVDFIKAEAMLKDTMYNASVYLTQMINEVSGQLHQQNSIGEVGLPALTGFAGGFWVGIRR